jgi:hypothetical protein
MHAEARLKSGTGASGKHAGARLKSGTGLHPK